MKVQYEVLALLANGSAKLLRPSTAHANDWGNFESVAEAKDYCDLLLDKGWRWPGVVALAVERVDGEDAERLYTRPLQVADRQARCLGDRILREKT